MAIRKNQVPWDQQIRDSEIFMVLGTEAYFQDAICACQVEYAKGLGKFFFILLKDGVDLPNNFLDGIENYKIAEWKTQEDLVSAVDRLYLEDKEEVKIGGKIT